jgi:hypothetical protein
MKSIQELNNASMSDLLTFAEEKGLTIPEQMRSTKYQKAVVEYLTRNAIYANKAPVHVVIDTTQECKLLVSSECVDAYVEFLAQTAAKGRAPDFMNSGYEIREDLGVVTDARLLFNYGMVKRVEKFIQLPKLGLHINSLKDKFSVFVVDVPYRVEFSFADEFKIQPITPNSIMVDGQLFTNCSYSVRILREDEEDMEEDDADLPVENFVDFQEMSLPALQRYARENLPDKGASIDHGIYTSQSSMQEYLDAVINGIDIE